MARSGIAPLFGELWAFMRVRKKWWLGPIVIVLALFGALIVFSQGSAIAPFVYTLFYSTPRCREPHHPSSAASGSPSAGCSSCWGW